MRFLFRPVDGATAGCIGSPQELRLKPLLLSLIAAVALAPTAAPAIDVDTLDLFELDANASDDPANSPDDDWDTPPNAGGAIEFTGIIEDVGGGGDRIFAGNNKDIHEVNTWTHKPGPLTGPDKNDITNAYAAAYESGTSTVAYFGADRFSNVGDAFLGFWFFRGTVTANADGTFTGLHTDSNGAAGGGDVLVLVNYPQGANAQPEIQVLYWETSCTRAANNDPQPGQCADVNLLLKAKQTGAQCSAAAPNQDFCAITNSGEVDAPWDYTPKAGNIGLFPFESFYEGGINLSILGGNSCFSTFMAESRSSKEYNATLKDFVLSSFELCSVAIVKNCTTGVLNPSQTGFIFNYSITVTNDGAGTLHNLLIVDDNGTPGVTADDDQYTLTSLAAEASETFAGTIETTQNPPTNTATVSAAGSPGGARTITDTASDQCERVIISPRIDVTKCCTTELTLDANNVVIAVNFQGQVCNTTSGATAVNLTNVTVTDDAGTPGDTSDDGPPVFGPANLPANTCQPYSGSYAPSSITSSDPRTATFSDTVTARGDGPFDSGTATATATDTCAVCTRDSCEPGSTP
ncbi:MAG TPA: hypothetical protein VGD45_13850 [Steroidobacter sp.]|uniref:hypothetical protein n=1 Tax=Steroidobacter sp. TaxID=1978227 RepID=UPI002ED7DEC8